MNIPGIELWVVLAAIGALAQTLRNVTAQSVSSKITPALNSWSRFAFCLPLAGLAAGLLVVRDGWPALPISFYGFCLVTALTQLLGNVALVIAFRAGSFGESIVFHKLEVVLTAIAGALWFAELPSRLGAFGIVLCAAGVISINLARTRDQTNEPKGWRSALHFGRAARFALLCAILLVAASFALKGANAILRAANPEAGFFEGAVHTLFHTTWIEVIVLSVWIAAREPQSFRSVPDYAPRMALIGAAGFTASLCWFWSFSLTLVAYAKAVGQIESLLAVAVGIYVLNEEGLRKQLPGIALTLLGITMVLLS